MECPVDRPVWIADLSQVALGALGGRELLGGVRVALTSEVLGEISLGVKLLALLGFNFNFDSLSIFFLAKNNLSSLWFTTVVFTFNGCLGRVSGTSLVSSLARSVSSGVGFSFRLVSGMVLI